MSSNRRTMFTLHVARGLSYERGMERPSDDELRQAILRKREFKRLPDSSVEWTEVDPTLHHICGGGAPVRRRPFLVEGKFALAWSRLVRGFFRRLPGTAAKFALAAVVSFGVILFVVGSKGGLSAAVIETDNQVAALVGGLAGGAVAFLVDVVLILTSKSDGKWYGRQFVFDERQLLFAVRVTDADNDKAFKIKVPGALRGAQIKFLAEVDRPDKRVKAQLNLLPAHMMDWENRPINWSGSMGVGRRNILYLVTNSAPEATATMVRVYMIWIAYPGKEGLDVKYS